MVPNLRTINHGFEFFAQNHSPCATATARCNLSQEIILKLEKVTGDERCHAKVKVEGKIVECGSLLSQHRSDKVVNVATSSSGKKRAHNEESNGRSCWTSSHSLSLSLNLTLSDSPLILPLSLCCVLPPLAPFYINIHSYLTRTHQVRIVLRRINIACAYTCT